MRQLRRALAVLVTLAAVAVLGVCWVMADIWLYGGTADEGPADAALVLGAAVAGDEPTPVFVERIRHAVELYKSGSVRMLVMTGGRNPFDDVSEAEAARDWAVANGVPATAILTEEASRTTLQNALFSRPILAAHGLYRVLVVSDPLHMRRAVTMARDAGIDATASPTTTSRYTSLSTQLPFLWSETWLYLSYRLTGGA